MCFVACSNFNAPAPESVRVDQNVNTDEFEDDTDDIPDDYEAGARSAAMIDTAKQVKVQLNVTNACSVTGNAAFKYKEGAISSGTLSYSAASSAQGFSSFSVARAKFNLALLKTFDKTKQYTIFIYVPAVKSQGSTTAKPASYKKVIVLPANPAAVKKKNAKGNSIGRPITTAVTSIGCN